MSALVERCFGAVVLVGVLAVGCGGSSSPEISADASRQLEGQVRVVRAAAVALDREGAANALAALRGTVADLRAHKKISADRASKILDAAATVEARLGTIPTTTTTPLPPSTADRRRGKDKDREQDHGGGD